MIGKYLDSKYKAGARGPVLFDCWGLVRAVRHEVFGLSMLPSFSDIAPEDKKSLTAACADTVLMNELLPVAAQPGAIATAWHGRVCVHIGIVVSVDGRTWVLETEDKTGPCLSELRKFEARYAKVIYYD